MILRKVVVFGVGLIGGSFALALKQAGVATQIVGIGRSKASLQRALELGIVDEISESVSAVSGADLVLIATPVAQTAGILSAIVPYLDAATVVTDAGSTKSDVVAAARKALGDKIGQFVPGHPIAGAEASGPDAATAALYRGKKVVLTALPENSSAAVALVTQAWQQCGAILHALTPEMHDQVFAAVSHLPHLLAFALVDDLARKPHADTLFQYAASGFRDFTRIAGSSPEMWRDIALANRDALLQELDDYQTQLLRMRSLLEQGDAAGLESLFHSARQARHDWLAAIEASQPPPVLPL
ncbi:prephenate dehydrogenase/arogenate dehydrogenase family protein [Herbaspirillum sp. RTI4]|uniref:prephenate dehydrogenase n=1 Tax=Herbaspirillum sp. RTI4 TaxID=3048640 RepID=UPI002AB5CD94|nr:prephenate dehydrogenase/arogenate dehydrogenase family protein [Herbaspirillum sp. RTI4]MDY7579903.1 prephenate dehydrogenase/arogenate dehydrogenase family protein [Herbaspirillum sp. RTI4]MEA9983338.1 prephenate dehydrogenase/arogenate dehydrogenase family protein [Herbaspirillum sp. RTI4]